MPEWRYDPIKDIWVLFSPWRRKRPMDLKLLGRSKTETCPFCEGNENMTPKESWALREKGVADGPGWIIRVVPNKFPALLSSNNIDVSDSKGLFKKKPGYGFHEVVIEGPEHDLDLNERDPERIFLILYALRERMRDLYKKDGIKYVQIFRNWGPFAGASLSHPHTQILAITEIPEIPKRELSQQRSNGVLSKMLHEERKRKDRIILESNNFVAFAPFASRFAYEVMIFPKKKMPDFKETQDELLKELAKNLKSLISAVKEVLGEVSYNLVIHSLKEREFHWHIEITPRVTGWAGFEIGTGYFINTVFPEEAAEELRKALGGSTTL